MQFLRLSRRLYSQKAPVDKVSAGPRTQRSPDEFKVFPFIAIFLAGTGAYVYMVKRRAGQSTNPPAETENTTSRYRRNA